MNIDIKILSKIFTNEEWHQHHGSVNHSFFPSSLSYNKSAIHLQCTQKWLGPGKKLRTQKSGSSRFPWLLTVVIEDEWGVYLATCAAAGGTCCSLWGMTAVTLGGRKEKKAGRVENTCPVVCPQTFETTSNSTRGSPYQAVNTTKPLAHASLYCHHPCFFPSTSFLLLLFNGESPLVRETKNLCYRATFYKTKEELLITNLLNC